MDVEVTPEYEKDFLEDILPMALGILARYTFPVWSLRSVLGVHSNTVKQISDTPEKLVERMDRKIINLPWEVPHPNSLPFSLVLVTWQHLEQDQKYNKGQEQEFHGL